MDRCLRIILDMLKIYQARKPTDTFLEGTIKVGNLLPSGAPTRNKSHTFNRTMRSVVQLFTLLNNKSDEDRFQISRWAFSTTIHDNIANRGGRNLHLCMIRDDDPDELAAISSPDAVPVTLDYMPYVTGNMPAVLQSTNCSCCYCLRTYPASEVTKWCREKKGKKTALCPMCGIDAVVPDHLMQCDLTQLRMWHIQGWGVQSLQNLRNMEINETVPSAQSETVQNSGDVYHSPGSN